VLFGLFNHLSTQLFFPRRRRVKNNLMALYYELPVYRDTYQLILKIFEYTGHFPKEYTM